MKEKLPLISQHDVLEKSVTYKFKGKIFIVEPVFQADGSEALSDVLLRLMNSEIKNRNFGAVPADNSGSQRYNGTSKYCFLAAGKEDL